MTDPGQTATVQFRDRDGPTPRRDVASSRCHRRHIWGGAVPMANGAGQSKTSENADSAQNRESADGDGYRVAV